MLIIETNHQGRRFTLKQSFTLNHKIEFYFIPYWNDCRLPFMDTVQRWPFTSRHTVHTYWKNIHKHTDIHKRASHMLEHVLVAGEFRMSNCAKQSVNVSCIIILPYQKHQWISILVRGCVCVWNKLWFGFPVLCLSGMLKNPNRLYTQEDSNHFTCDWRSWYQISQKTDRFNVQK